MMRSLLAGLLIVTVSCAGTRYIDSDPAPPAVLPPVALPQEPIPAGMGRVVLDTPEGPASVEIKYPTETGAMGWRPLCTSPCVADVPVGNHEISFVMRDNPKRNDTAVVPIAAGTTVYRRNLTERDDSAFMLGAGYFVAYTGITVLLIGLLIAAIPDVTGNAGRNTAIVGAGMTVGGSVMFYYGWPSVKKGQGTQFMLQPAPAQQIQPPPPPMQPPPVQPPAMR